MERLKGSSKDGNFREYGVFLKKTFASGGLAKAEDWVGIEPREMGCSRMFGKVGYDSSLTSLPIPHILIQRCSEGEGASERIAKSRKLSIFVKTKGMARDLYHENFRRALEKDGWCITHDPFPIRVGRIGYEVDFGAEKLIAAEKGNEKIAVELKSFEGPSDINEFHRAMGQFNDYDANLAFIEPERTLYVAVPEEAWEDFFQELAIQRALKRNRARIVVYNPVLETLVQWITQ